MGKLREWWGKRLVEQEKAQQNQEKAPDRWEAMKDIWHTTFSRANIGDPFEQYENILGIPDAKEVRGDVTTCRYIYLEAKEDAEPVHHKMEFDLKAGAIVDKRSKNV